MGKSLTTFPKTRILARLLILAAGLWALGAPMLPAHAAQTIPYKVNFQGRLTDNNGNVMADGSYNMKFRLFTAATGGTNSWEGDRVYGAADYRVSISNGLFNIQFGDTTLGDPALSPALFSNGTYPLYLEVELPTPATASCASNGCASWTEGAMSPRQPLASSPYAFNADTVDGIDGSSLVVLNSAQQSGTINVSGSITSGGTVSGGTISGGTLSGTTVSASSATLTGTNALTLGSTSSAAAILFQDGTANNYKVTLNTAALAAPYTLTLPTSAPGTSQCLQSGATTASQLAFGSCGSGGSTSLQAAYTAGNAITTADNRDVAVTLANTTTDANFLINSACTPGTDCSANGGRFAVQTGGVDTFSVLPGGGTVFKNTGDSTVAFRVQNAGGTSLLNVDTLNTGVINNGTRSLGNELENPGFELTGVNASGGWLYNANQTDSTNAHGGNHFDLQTAGSVNKGAITSKYYAVTPGEQIYAEGWVKTAAGTNGTGGVNIEFTDKDKANATYVSSDTTNPGTTWTLKTDTTTVPAGKYFARVGELVTSSSTTGSWYFDDFYLSRAQQQAPQLFKNSLNSTTAFQIQNTGGGSLFNADTTNSRIGIGTNAPETALQVNAATYSAAFPFNTLLTDTTAAAQGVGGGIGFSGSFDATGIDDAFAAIQGVKENGTLGNYSGALRFLTRPNGGSLTEVARFGSNGAATFKNSTNSTSAFSIQNAAGAPLFQVDSTTYNLLTNPGFEIGTNGTTPSGWVPTGLTATQDNSTYFFGLASMKIVTSAAGQLVRANSFNGSVTNSSGSTQSYTFSYYSLSASSFATVNVGWNNGTTDADVCTAQTIPQGWSRNTCTISVPNGSTINSVYIKDTGSGHTFWVDSTQLELNSVATPYRIGGIQIRGTVTNPLTLQNSSDSVTAFQLQNKAGTSNLMVADTLNNKIGVGGAPSATGQIFQVNGGASATTGLYTGAVAAERIDASGNLLNIGAITGTGDVGIKPGADTQTAFNVKNAAGTTTFFKVDTENVSDPYEVQIGSSTVPDSTQINFGLDNYNVYADTASSCGTPNNGSLYYNSVSNSVRGCINGAWEDMVSTAGLGLQLFGVVPDTGTSNQGDMAGVTGLANGPCRVSVGASTTTVSWTACTAYSGGRKSSVTAGTATTTNAVAGQFQHLCLTNNGQPALSTAGAETANLATVSFASAASPILCLADIKFASANNTITTIYDTRTFTTTEKEFATAITTNPVLGSLVVGGATTPGAVTAASAASQGNLRGVVVASSGATSTTALNVIIATHGAVPVKAITGTSNAVNNALISTTTAGYATTTTTLTTTTLWSYLGLARTAWTGTTTCTANANTCAGSILTSVNIR